MNKIISRLITLVMLVMMLLVVGDQSALAARGQIQSLFPPGNNGSNPGAGLINPRNASGALTGPPYHVFQTPGDVTVTTPMQVLFEGLDVTYTQSTGNQATAVQRDVL